MRVLAHPVEDSTEVATRIAFTGANGEFVIRLQHRRAYVLRVRRVGFGAEPDRIVDLTRLGDVDVSITLRAISIPLAPVHVIGSTREPRCLGIDDPEQSELVRQWLDAALFALRTRRITERALSYSVTTTRIHTPAQRSMDGTFTYTHVPGARPSEWLEDDAANLAGIARRVALRSSDEALPTEMTLLLPSFRSSYCFMNVITPAEDGTWAVGLLGRSVRPAQPEIQGTLRFGKDGIAIAGAQFRFVLNGRAAGSVYLAFDAITLEGESFPILFGRGRTRLPVRESPRQVSVDERFRYGAVVRQRQP